MNYLALPFLACVQQLGLFKNGEPVVGKYVGPGSGLADLAVLLESLSTLVVLLLLVGGAFGKCLDDKRIRPVKFTRLVVSIHFGHGNPIIASGGAFVNE